MRAVTPVIRISFSPERNVSRQEATALYASRLDGVICNDHGGHRGRHESGFASWLPPDPNHSVWSAHRKRGVPGHDALPRPAAQLGLLRRARDER
jgi:hypothetical protein